MPTREARQQQFEALMQLLQSRRRPALDPTMLKAIMAPPEPEGPAGWRPYAAAGVRGLSGLLAFPGGALGAGVSGLGETLAEKLEESPLSPTRIGVEAGLGAVPLAALFKMGRPAASLIRGALYGGVGEAGRELARGEEVSPGAVTGSAALAGIVGGGLAKLLGAQKGLPPSAAIVEPTAQGGGQTLWGGKITRGRRPSQLDKLTGAKLGPTQGPMVIPSTEQKIGLKPFPSGVEDLAPETRMPLGERPEFPIRLKDIDPTLREAGYRTPYNIPATPSTPEIKRLLQLTGGTLTGQAPKLDETLLKALEETRLTPSVSLPPAEPAALPRLLGRQADVRALPEPGRPARFAPDVGAPSIPSSLEALLEKAKTGAIAEPEAPRGLSDLLASATAAETKVKTLLDEVTRSIGPRAPAVVETAETPLTQLPRAVEPPIATATKLPYVAPSLRTILPEITEKVGPAGEGVLGDPAQLLNLVGERGHYGALKALIGQTKAAGQPIPTELAGARQMLGRATQQAGQLAPEEAAKFIPTPPAPAAPSMTAEQAQAIIARTGHAPGTPEALGPARGGTTIGSLLGGGQDVAAIAQRYPQFAARLGLGAAGAAIGGLTDPLDNPLLSAAAGGAAGAALPSVPSILSKIASISPHVAASIPAQAAPVLEAAQTPAGFHSMVKQVMDTLPAALRFNFLFSPNLVNNIFVGPYGSGLMKGLELTLMGDPRGRVILANLANPITVGNKMVHAWSKAKQLVGTSERLGGELMGEAPGKVRQLLATPGTMMTTGDVGIREILMEAGLTEAEARLATMTADPRTGLGRALVNVSKTPMGQILLPFARTLVNIVEGSIERTPFLGAAMGGSLREQLVKQGMGAGTAGLGFAAGLVAPEDVGGERFFRSAVGNIGGPAALLSGGGYAAARALKGGKTGKQATRTGLTQMLQSVPLPTTEIPQSWVNYALSEVPVAQRRLPSGSIPTALRHVLEADTPRRQPRRPPRPRRYRSER